jgi:hypothetical protein
MKGQLRDNCTRQSTNWSGSKGYVPVIMYLHTVYPTVRLTISDSDPMTYEKPPILSLLFPRQPPVKEYNQNRLWTTVSSVEPLEAKGKKKRRV